MDVWKYLAMGGAAVFGAMRAEEAAKLLKPEGRFPRYAWAGLFLAFYLGLGLVSGGRVQPVCVADLLLTYGLLAAVDKKIRIVPGKVLLFYLAAQALLGIVLKAPAELLGTLLSGAAAAVLFYGLSWIARGKMGMGDASLLSVTAMTAGWQYTAGIFLLGLFLSFLYSLYLLLVRKKDMKTEFPFVPFLAGAAVFQTLRGFL